MFFFIATIVLFSNIGFSHDRLYVPKPKNPARTRINIEQVIADMSLPSEALVVDPRFDWQHRPRVTMHAPRGEVIPDWWHGNRPLWTRAVVPWFTAFEAQGNGAKNSRIQVTNLRFFILSNRTRRWIEIEQRLRPEVKSWVYPFRQVGEACGKSLKVDGDGHISVLPEYPYFLHGWGRGHKIDASDVGATFTAMEFRLVMHDGQGQDDRAAARYVVDVGADYYPDMTLRWSLDYAPGMGNGRMLLARKYWRTASLLIPNPEFGITLDDLRRNPPPLVARHIEQTEKYKVQCPQ